MIQTVLKRDGRIVGYNEEKIKAAIRKAMLTTDLGEDEALILKIADRIGVTGKESMTVEEIQDRVEVELMKSPRKEVAKKIYRIPKPAQHCTACQDTRHLPGNNRSEKQRHHTRKRQHEHRLPGRHDDEIRK